MAEESRVLQGMGSILNKTISNQSDLVVFGDAVSSANFVSEQLVNDIKSMGETSKLDKVSRIMAAVKDRITFPSCPEKITKRFNDFVLLIRDDLDLLDLAEQLVQKLGKCMHAALQFSHPGFPGFREAHLLNKPTLRPCPDQPWEKSCYMCNLCARGCGPRATVQLLCVPCWTQTRCRNSRR